MGDVSRLLTRVAVYEWLHTCVCVCAHARNSVCVLVRAAVNSERGLRGDGLFVLELIVICSIHTNCSNLSVLFLFTFCVFVCACARALVFMCVRARSLWTALCSWSVTRDGSSTSQRLFPSTWDSHR